MEAEDREMSKFWDTFFKANEWVSRKTAKSKDDRKFNRKVISATITVLAILWFVWQFIRLSAR